MWLHREQTETPQQMQSSGSSVSEKLSAFSCHPPSQRQDGEGTAFLTFTDTTGSVCRGRELSLQRDKQTDSKPGSPLFCAWNSKTIEGAICNQKQNQTTGRAPCERFPLQSWLASEQEQLLISSVRVKHSQHVCNCRNAPRRTKEIFPS